MGNLPLAPGSLFANRFEIQRAAGSGGMGTIYRATDRYSSGTVALKLLHSGTGTSDEAERFAREAQLLSELRHPGIVAHVAHGQTPDGQRFLAMEWLAGQDLGERLARGPLPVRDCLRLLEQVASALAVAHQRGVIHRDLKPTNLFLVGGDVGRVKLLDFGIARRIAASQAMTRTGMVVGTPEYMAPEQARGSRDLTPATDLFSLGCVLYECLTGQPPFVADHIAAVLVRILFEEPIPIEDRRPGVPVALSALLGRLLAKQPAQRVADAAALRAELASLGEVPEPALAVTVASPKPKAEGFAEQEQSLFSIVLAAPPEEDIGLGVTQPGSGVLLEETDRRALLQALAGLGGSPDILANGTLVLTVPPLGSAQDQATVAARAALLIKERWPEAVVSMATGRGSVRGRTAVGEVVELAARSIKSGSHPTAGKPTIGVMIDPLSAKLLAGRFAQTRQPAGALLLHEERDVDASRPLLGKPTPCVGREAELGTLESQLSGCIEESEARVVLITAPPGIGKSRLRHEFLRRIEKRSEPVTVLLGRGDMMSAGAPFGIVRSAIHNLCGISGSEPLETQRERLRARIAQHQAASDADRVVLFVGELCNIPFPEEGMSMLQAARQDPKIMRECLRRALLDFLAAECAAAPVLLILDDLHWGDELTVSVLDEALREQAGAPLFILSFGRPEVHEVFPKLWQSHKMQEILLKGLSKKACERLIVQMLGKDVAPDAVARAVEHSAGNALFLEEIIRSIAEGKPETQSETVVAMLQARLGRLDGNLRRAVLAASTFGQTFWHGGVSSILGHSSTAPEVEGWLSALVDAELIQPHPQSRLAKQSEYGFRHALVRDAAYSLLTSSDLRMGHRLAGEFLEAAGESNAAIIAEHFERSGETQRAAGFYLRAAESCLDQSDLAGASRHSERGLGCSPQGVLRAQLIGTESYALFILDKLDRIRDELDAALRELPPGSLAWCRSVLIGFMHSIGKQDVQRSSAMVGLLLQTDPHEDAQPAYAGALFLMGALLVVGAPGQVMEMIGQRFAVCIARAAPQQPTIRRYEHGFRVLMTALREPRPWTLVTEGQIAVNLVRQLSDEIFELTMDPCLAPLGWLDLGDWEGMLKHLLAIEPRIQQCQIFAMGAYWLRALGRVLAYSQEDSLWTQVEQHAVSLLAKAQGFVLNASIAHEILARVALWRGQLDRAVAHTAEAMKLLPVCPAMTFAAAAVQISALLALTRVHDAVGVAEQMLSIIPVLSGIGVFEVEFRLAASVAFRAAGNIDRAQAELRETLRQIQLRADDITDAFWKNSYLTRNPYCARAQALAKEWGLEVAVE